MPDPNQTDPTNINQVPTQGDSSSDTTIPPVPAFQSADSSATTPMPPINLPDNPSAATTIEDVKLPEDQGSSAPSDLPPMTPSTPKKKFGGGRIIATILGFLTLIGGVAGGVILTQQQQDIREKASVDYACSQYGSPEARQACQAGLDQAEAAAQAAVPSNQMITVNVWRDGIITGNPADIVGTTTVSMNSYNANQTLPYQGGGYSQSQVLNDQAGLNQAGYYCPSGSCPQEWDTDVAGYYVAPNGQYYPISILNNDGEPTEPEAPPPVVTETPTASCQNVKAYTETWGDLTAVQLSQSKVGDKVNFCVAGTTTQGTFDKAKFTINSVAQAETTTKRPSSSDYCQLYTIPAGTTTFSISAQIHHATLDWK